MNTINKELRDRAVSLGLCDKWQKSWVKDKSPQQLIDMFKKGIDFCFETGFPDNDFIKENISKEILKKNNMFVDEEFYKANPENDCVILGNSQGKLTFDGYAVRDIYVNGDADVEIEAKDFSKIFVNVYGNSQVCLLQKGCSSVNVYRHGDNNITYTGEVNIRESV